MSLKEAMCLCHERDCGNMLHCAALRAGRSDEYLSFPERPIFVRSFLITASTCPTAFFTPYDE